MYPALSPLGNPRHHQVPTFLADIQSGSAFEALTLEVGNFSIAPCVQSREASELAIESSRHLHETAVAVALQGPQPELLGVMRSGVPLKVHVTCCTQLLFRACGRRGAEGWVGLSCWACSLLYRVLRGSLPSFAVDV